MQKESIKLELFYSFFYVKWMNIWFIQIIKNRLFVLYKWMVKRSSIFFLYINYINITFQNINSLNYENISKKDFNFIVSVILVTNISQLDH